MSARARFRGVRISPQKARLVADLVRGRDVATAVAILRHTPKRAAKIICKAIESARANALETTIYSEDDLVVARIQVDPGPSMKRFRPMSMGRAGRIIKRTSHVTVELGRRVAG